MNRFDPLDEAIDEALGENPREDELAQMIAALNVRRETFERELTSADSEDAQKQWRAKIKEVEKQIEALRNDQAISGFVERSVRASATRPRPSIEWEELE
jgi:hypothetical protein